MSISFTDDQNSALALFHNGACIFLSGSGGPGKTMIVKEMISRAGCCCRINRTCSIPYPRRKNDTQFAAGISENGFQQR